MADDYRDIRDFEAYLRLFQSYASPLEAQQFLRDIGSIDDIRERNAIVLLMIRERQGRVAVWQFLKTASIYFVSAVGLVATIRSILPVEWLPW